MAFNKKPVTGMRDILPGEAGLRARLMGIIRQTYAGYGFAEIETPIVEHLANLSGSGGGENEKLIFRVLKRGDDLRRGLASLGVGDRGPVSPGEDGSGPFDIDISLLSEEGLRYDLTVPLARYYAANAAKLPQPFKALQTGPVFRADRPQRGRFRQFTQCDIDILGDASSLAEKELIIATAAALRNIGFDRYGFYVLINDRRLLLELIAAAGLPDEDAMKILIILDKADKIGADGVDRELVGAGYPEVQVARLRSLLCGIDGTRDGVSAFVERIGNDRARMIGDNITDIMDAAACANDIKIVFDPTLVRGMGYYTGTIFEIKTEAFSSSVGGGGRYDGMVAGFGGQDVPAVGFSIGFERVMTILMEDMPSARAAGGEAWLIEKGMPSARVAGILSEAERERAAGKSIYMAWAAKNKKFQKENLAAGGYTEFREFYTNELKKD